MRVDAAEAWDRTYTIVDWIEREHKCGEKYNALRGDPELAAWWLYSARFWRGRIETLAGNVETIYPRD